MKSVIPAGLLTLALSMQATATPILAAVCEEPKGPRVDISPSQDNGSPSVKHSEDGYANVHPLFLIDSSDPKVLRYTWGPTRAFGEGLAATQQVVERSAKIAFSTTEMLSAVEVYGTNRTSIFTLYPRLGFAIVTHHEFSDVVGRHADAMTFTFACKFTQ